ncbi:MAG: SPOR domain-containing protein, partial [Bacteroides sp.]|nr:SPOR domain-containing protein [Bacteroides sp.]
HENGKAELPQIGELRYSIYDKVSFIAYDNKLTTPALYGLGSFEMLPLKSLVKPVTTKLATSATLRIVEKEAAQPHEEERTIKLQTNHRKLRIGPAWAAAMVAVVVLAFFYIYPFNKVPVTQQYSAERAELVPTEQLMKAVVEKVDQPLVQPVIQEETMQQEPIRKEITPVITTEDIVAPKAEVKQPQPQVRKRYHVIVASVATEDEVHAMVNRLKSAGNDEAQAIIGGGKMRVSIASYATMAEANEAAAQQQATYKGAWVLKK